MKITGSLGNISKPLVLELMQNGLEANEVPPEAAAGLVEMFASIRSGALEEDYYRNRPAVTEKVRKTDFAKEFAATFDAK